MLYLISLGLGNKEDISIKAMETAKKCDILYLESYTNVLNYTAKDLGAFFSKEVIPLSREAVENKSKLIVNEAKTKNVGLLVGGDCLSATTHVTLMLEAHENDVKIEIIHGSSIFTAVAETGLSLYKFGKVASIPFENEDVESPYDILVENQNINAHTLFLLDLKPEEKKFLRIGNAIHFLLKLELKKHKNVFKDDTLCIGCARLGMKNSLIKVAQAKDLVNVDFGEGPYCLIVPAKQINFVEREALSYLE